MHIFKLTLILFLILSSVYLATRFHKIEIINNIKDKRLSWGISIGIVLIGRILSFIFGLTITLYIYHLVIIFLIFELLNRFLKKKIKYLYICIIAILLTSAYFVYGMYNAKNIRETNYVVYSEKIKNKLNIIQLTDIHLGTTHNSSELQEIFNNISNKHIDVLVLTGDIVDENTKYNDIIKLGSKLRNIKTKYGVYLIFGNHDLNTHNDRRDYTSDQLIATLESNGIHVLKDETTLINDEFYIIGRKDRTNKNRLDIKDLTKDLDKEKFIISLDHQPVHYNDNIISGVDLMLSGHTHNGQMFPLKYFIDIFSHNEMTYGIKKQNNTTFIVSSGLSSWGSPLKAGAVNEIVNITINPK